MDHDSLTHTVQSHSPALYRLAYTQLRSAADAEDAVQEAFLRLLRAAPPLENDAHTRAWLMRVTLNICRDMLRSPWRRRRDELPEDIPAEGEDERADLLRAVLALPPKYRAAIHLHYYEGYSIREIADLLGCPAATVGTRLARARRLLYNALSEKEDCHEKA